MRFENTEVMNFKGAIRGMRNPLESWDKSDSEKDGVIGENDMKLMQTLLRFSIKEGNSHSKFVRQIAVFVDITAPMYWWSEFDTYKVGTVANSTSKMHKLATTPITLKCFETDDFASDIYLETDGTTIIPFLENLRQKYIETKDKRYWKELIRWLPESWLQTRSVLFNYQVIRQMYFDRRNHKLTEWSISFVRWVESLPYAKELIMYEGDKRNG